MDLESSMAKIPARRKILVAAPDDRWGTLCQEFPRMSVLSSDPIYALPRRLITIIQKQVPGFLSAREVRFERRLRELGGAGFYRAAPIVFDWAGHPEDFRTEVLPDVFDTRLAIAEDELAQLEREDLQERLPATRVDEVTARRNSIEQAIRERSRGYLGWLAMNREFRSELKQIVPSWTAFYAEERENPTSESVLLIPSDSRNSRADSRHDSELNQQGMQVHLFLKRWCLDRIVTPDFVIPARPDILNASTHNLAGNPTEPAATITIPWYLMVDQRFALLDVREEAIRSESLVHLREWINGGPAKFGYQRFGLLYTLYVYWDLAIAQRYGDRMKGQTEKLVAAFSVYFHQLVVELQTNSLQAKSYSEDSIRKLRTRINKYSAPAK